MAKAAIEASNIHMRDMNLWAQLNWQIKSGWVFADLFFAVFLGGCIFVSCVRRCFLFWKEIIMPKFTMHAREFKTMRDPNRKPDGHTKYICYLDTATIPQELQNWSKTNPRDQKMTTDAAKSYWNKPFGERRFPRAQPWLASFRLNL